MSNVPQCPSTIGEQQPPEARPELQRSSATGRVYWRSLDELADSPQFREHLEREFPAFASELRGASRRDFMRVMAASLALAGVISAAPGCRRPDFKILPYSRDPEDVIHGKSLYYATALPLACGGAEGLIVETHEGRPTKVEGNPLHPINQGRSSVYAQSAILDLYDPDRLVGVTELVKGERAARTWAEFEAFAGPHFARFDSSRGAGLAFLVEKITCPTRDALRDRLLSRWPQAKWLPYEAIDDESAIEGSAIAFGKPHRQSLNTAKAKVIVALDRDFTTGFGEGGSLPDARGFAAGRRVLATSGDGSQMNRLYSIEGAITATGGCADHRLRLRPSQVGLYGAALGAAVAQKLGGGPLAAGVSVAEAAKELGIGPEWIDAVADDLAQNKGASLVLVGPTQPAPVHALALALNALLENVGKTVRYAPLTRDCAASSLASIKALGEMIEAGAVDTLVVLGPNPVYSAPADIDFAKLYPKAKTTIQLGLHPDETGLASTWRLNRAHWLETWGDVDAIDGSRSVIQPMIAPLAYDKDGVEGGRSELELLALILAEPKREGYELVRGTWREALGLNEGEFEKAWRRALHDGVLAGAPGSSERSAPPAVNTAAVASAVARLAKPSPPGAIEVIFRPSYATWDGRFANNGWLQELPNPASKLTWDNPALIAPATADRLKLTDGTVARVSVGGRSLDIAVWRQPGLAEDTILLDLGYGRSVSGRIGKNVGFNTYTLRASGAMRLATGATIEPTSGAYQLCSVQSHWAMEGRPVILEADLPAWLKHGGEVRSGHDAYGRPRALNFADQLPPNQESHLPAPVDAYLPWQEHKYVKPPQWGMSIDLTTCSGCGACTIACQAENNIPVVGKAEVAKGREMHWIRVDRYFGSPAPAAGHEAPHKLSGDFGATDTYVGGRLAGDVDMLVMPVPCMHCENAPCETVCPVNATEHGAEGLNEMAYNRCIGTRYCSNNCPYKVRRFNYFDFATKRLHGTYIGESVLGGVVSNEQLIPPRLREKMGEGIGEAQTMQYNPDVTVRERGIMEKCTYCVQRINESRVEVKLLGLDHIPDGFFQTACQQACPTESIVFGDIADPLSRVRALRDNGRNYGLIGYLNTRPRTTYLTRLRNPNKRLRAPVEDPFHHEGGESGHPAGHGSEPEKDKGHVMSLPVLPSRREVAASLGGRAGAAALGMGGLA